MGCLKFLKVRTNNSGSVQIRDESDVMFHDFSYPFTGYLIPRTPDNQFKVMFGNFQPFPISKS